MKIYDITPSITSKIAVFPGDQEFVRKIELDFKNGNNLLLSSYLMSAHTGAHADAPNHYHPDGESIDVRSLHYYFGPAQVIDVHISPGKRIEVKDVEKIKIEEERVLIKTQSFPDPNRWNHDFNSLSADLIDYLNSRKVQLIGIDTPSIDPWDDKELESHQAVYKFKMAVLEGIVLAEIPSGIYWLSALPLKIEGGDAGPVRAILVEGMAPWK